jgi:hypothetical protein
LRERWKVLGEVLRLSVRWQIGIERCFASTGGEGGIRTLDALSRMPDFESGTFNQLCHFSDFAQAVTAWQGR